MGTLDQSIAALQSSVSTFSTAVQTAANRKTPTAGQADNANALNGQSATQMVASAAGHTDTHANRTDNPHATTPAQLGAYTTSQVNALIAALLPSGIFPIDQFGTVDANLLPVSGAGSGTLTLAAGVPLVMAGQYFVLPVFTVTPGVSKTLLCYIKLVSGAPTFVTSATALAESLTNMYIGTVITDASGNVSSQSLNKVTRIDGYRISITAAGSAIPVSTGLPSQTGALAWK